MYFRFVWMSRFHILALGSAAVVIDERPVTPCLSDIVSPAVGSRRLDWVARRATLLRGGGSDRSLPSATVLLKCGLDYWFRAGHMFVICYVVFVCFE